MLKIPKLQVKPDFEILRYPLPQSGDLKNFKKNFVNLSQI